MKVEQEKAVKARLKKLSAKSRNDLAKALIQCCLIGSAAIGYPACNSFIKNGFLRKYRGNLNITDEGIILLEMSKDGRAFLAIGNKGKK